MEHNTEQTEATYRIAASCPECGKPLRLRTNRKDQERFLGCSNYPHCRFAEDFDPVVAKLAARLAELEKGQG